MLATRRRSSCGFPWIDEINADACEVRGVAGRERSVQDPADSSDLSVGGADRLAGVFPCGDDPGILIGGKDVEGLDPVAEVGSDKRVLTASDSPVLRWPSGIRRTPYRNSAAVIA
jgi:hypothetical protein